MNVLVIAAHPDDEVLGCGGTIARLSAEGNQVHVVIMGEGITARHDDRSDANPNALNSLHAHASRAGQILGAISVEVLDLPDNRFDTVPMLDINKRVERLVEKHRPDVIYTHHAGDLNLDHVITHRAVLTATRPMSKSAVKTIYTFEVASSSEWSFGATGPAFSPNVFIDIEKFTDAKCEAMSAYESEARDFPHPRSTQALRAQATRWGAACGCAAAEAFQLIRDIR
ncbi:MAG: PIG-L family deacetylase [Phycisphaerae bacterium]|nr:PIG-L family deacetylase [Phycisphaerales bacterium]